MKRSQKMFCLILVTMLIMGTAVTVTNAIAAPNSGILPSTDASIEKWVFSSSTIT